MGRTTGFLSQTSGKLDDNFQTRQTDHGTFWARNPRKTAKTRRSEKQANTRCQMANASANYRLYNGKLSEAFENKSAGVNDFNSFVQVNYGKTAVYITKQESNSGGCVLANYQFSHGSIPSVGMGLNQNGVLVSDIALGNLVIDANTTVADLTMAILTNNGDHWVEKDQITHFYAEQWIDIEGVPRATMTAQKVLLNLSDQTKLWNVVSARGFSSIPSTDSGQGGYYLAMNAALSNSGGSWVHSRTKADGSTQVSTQRLIVVSDILDDYTGYEAMVASAESYGGINTKSAYLNPQSSINELMGNSQSSSNSSSSSSGSSSSNGSSSSSGSNDSSTDSGTDDNTVTVAAPMFSGDTQFTESTQVTMSAESGAEIRYTLDGSTPTAESTLYSAPVTLSETTTVKAIAIKDGVSSTVTSRTYTKTAGNSGGGVEEG